MPVIQFSALFFYTFAACIITSALLVIILPNPVHAVLSLITSFLSASGLFILIGADFIALSLVIVYVGAVAVLFLFVVMMLNMKDRPKIKIPIYYVMSGLLIALVLIANLYLVITKSSNYNNIIPSYSMSVGLTNTAAIGNILYTDFFYPFQVAGLLLLLAMIAAIVLNEHKKKSIKRQNMMNQFNRTRAESVKLVDVQFYQGVQYDN